MRYLFLVAINCISFLLFSQAVHAQNQATEDLKLRTQTGVPEKAAPPSEEKYIILRDKTVVGEPDKVPETPTGKQPQIKKAEAKESTAQEAEKKTSETIVTKPKKGTP